MAIPLAEGGFQCAQQRKSELRTHRIVGFGALVRWVDQKGLVHPPAGFLKLAGEMEMLDSITRLFSTSSALRCRGLIAISMLTLRTASTYRQRKPQRHRSCASWCGTSRNRDGDKTFCLN
ncbi:MAG: hypothetical protein ABIU96_10895 [Rhodanobacter sp.]